MGLRPGVLAAQGGGAALGLDRARLGALAPRRPGVLHPVGLAREVGHERLHEAAQHHHARGWPLGRLADDCWYTSIGCCQPGGFTPARAAAAVPPISGVMVAGRCRVSAAARACPRYRRGPGGRCSAIAFTSRYQRTPSRRSPAPGAGREALQVGDLGLRQPGLQFVLDAVGHFGLALCPAILPSSHLLLSLGVSMGPELRHCLLGAHHYPRSAMATHRPAPPTPRPRQPAQALHPVGHRLGRGRGEHLRGRAAGGCPGCRHHGGALLGRPAQVGGQRIAACAHAGRTRGAHRCRAPPRRRPRTPPRRRTPCRARAPGSLRRALGPWPRCRWDRSSPDAHSHCCRCRCCHCRRCLARVPRFAGAIPGHGRLGARSSQAQAQAHAHALGVALSAPAVAWAVTARAPVAAGLAGAAEQADEVCLAMPSSANRVRYSRSTSGIMRVPQSLARH